MTASASRTGHERLLIDFDAGNKAALARAVSVVENHRAGFEHLLATFHGRLGRARRIGITRPPGAGKSTITTSLVAAYRAEGCSVGVIAVDPTSPFTGGALLGDRVRMQDHATDSGVFIRSMASRGHLGGLAWSTPQALRVLDAAGCEIVLVETVGVGQAEVEVASLADSTIVLVAPGMGDAIQAAKAGILEVADVFVVNKADRDGADQTARDLRNMLSLGERRDPAAWQPPIVKTVASRGEGVDDVVAALDAHHAWLLESGRLDAKRRVRAAEEVESLAVTALREQMGDLRGGSLLDELAGQVVAGEIDPYAAAYRLVDAVRDH